MGAGFYYEIKTTEDGTIIEGEIERIITLLSESDDVDVCKNIAKDLFRLMINEIKSSQELKLTEKAIECGVLKVVAKKSKSIEDPVLCKLLIVVISAITDGLAIAQEKTCEEKRMMIISSIVDSYSKGTDLLKEKGLEAAIAYEGQTLLNCSEVMFDGLSGLLIEKIKNEKTNIKEKRNIIILFDNVINSGTDVKEEKELLQLASDLEEEGRKMMIKEEISKEEWREWKELVFASLTLETTIIDKEEGEEGEKMSLLNMIQDTEKEKKEKEEAIKRCEEAQKKLEEQRRETEKEIKEKEELLRQLELEKKNFEDN